MKQEVEIGIAVVCMVAMFGLGIWVGTDNITYEVKEDELSYQNVEYTGTINKGGYEVRFVEEIEKPEKWKNTSIVINGQALSENGQKVIKLRTNRSAKLIHQTCNHEVLHHYFPSYRHPNFLNPANSRSDDPIYKLEDQVDLPVCDDITATALQRQR